MRIGSKIVVFLVSISLAFNTWAFWQFLAPVSTAVMWLGRVAASNPTMARAVEWSLTAHGAAVGYFLWKNSSDTSPETTTPVKARLVIQPNTTAQRDNPDTTKWDNPASGQRDPSPKASMLASSMSDYPPQNAPICDIVQKAIGTPYDTYSFASGYTKVTYLTTTTYTNPGAPYGQAGSYTCNGTFYYLWSKSSTFTPTCPTGYTLSGTGSSTTCTLTASPSTIQKPSGKVPCEVLQNGDGTWDVDSRNPECASLASALTKSADGKTLSYNKGDGTYDQVSNNSDGSETLTTGNRTINLGPPGADGNRTITAISDSGPSSPGSGTGGTGSTGGTGTGSAVCGGLGLPACATSVDDSGFNGKDATVNTAGDTANGKLDDRQAAITGYNGSGNFGLDVAWMPSLLPGAPVQCQALRWEPAISHGPLAGHTGSVDVDWCGKLDVIREFIAWLVGIVTVLAIARLFFSSNGNAGRPAG
ncbi:MAG TPA: hypothetical protein VFF03_09455 [Rhodocyclaceae bacterium]|nr:hypothetical protein [Rhodocyclaceae bacterium]